MSADTVPQPKEWDLSRLALSAKQTEIARALQAWLEKSPSALAKSIADFSGGEFTSDHMHLIEDELIRAFPPLSQATEYLKVLCKLVDAINLNESQPLPLPRIPILAIRPKNPFRENIPEALQRVRCWRNVFVANPNADADNQHVQVPCAEPAFFGKLYTSAVLHGGLAHTDLLVGLARALADPVQHIVWQNKRICLELSLSWQGEMGSEYRIWYPDSMSAMLIVQFLSAKTPEKLDKTHATDQQLRGEIWTQANQFFKTTSLKMAERPKSLHQLTRFAKIDLQTRLPQVLVSYAGRNLVSHSLDRRVAARIYGFNLPAATTKAKITDISVEPKNQVTQFNQNSDDLNDMEPVWLNGMRKAFALDDARLVKSKLEIIETSQPKGTIEHCFASFAVHLVSARSASNNKLALSTSRAYLVTVSKQLGGRLGSVDPCRLGSSALETMYWEILEEASDSQNVRSKHKGIARALREFHHFLVQNDHATSIDYREVLGVGKGLVPVNANLITFDDFSGILLQLPDSIRIHRPNQPHMNKLLAAARLIFILAFKCGLRPMEVLMLKLCDFCEHDPAELLVRPSEARRLKTKNATRKLPLYALLSESELAELRQWKKARLTELQSISSDASALPIQQKFLFGIPELKYDFIPQETVFPILHHAMREVTGDESIRFYNLRHSFASWTMLRLMLSDLPVIPGIFPHLPETTQRLKESADFRKKLYGRGDLTRRHVYAVALLLGHAGPATSLEHYIHFCDVLLACWLNIDVAAPRKTPLVRQSGIPQSTAYRWISKGVRRVPYLLARRKKQIKRLSKSAERFSTSEKKYPRRT